MSTTPGYLQPSSWYNLNYRDPVVQQTSNYNRAITSVNPMAGFSTLGASTQSPPITQPQPKPSPTGDGGGNGGNTSYVAPAVDPLWAEIQRIADESMGTLNQAQSNLVAQQPGIESDINARYGVADQELGQQQAQGERNIAQGETEAGARKENALAAARRLANELSMGGQQRFGGASSAGQAYSELTGREYQRGAAQTQSSYQDAMVKFAGLKANLTEKIAVEKNRLEVEKQSAITQAKRDFDNKMLQIRSMKGEVESNKAQMRLQALQDLRNQVFQIELAKVNDTQALDNYKKTIEDQMNNVLAYNQQSGQQVDQTGQNLLDSTTVVPDTELEMSQPQGSPVAMMTGRVKRDEDLMSNFG